MRLIILSRIQAKHFEKVLAWKQKMYFFQPVC